MKDLTAHDTKYVVTNESVTMSAPQVETSTGSQSVQATRQTDARTCDDDVRSEEGRSAWFIAGWTKERHGSKTWSVAANGAVGAFSNHPQPGRFLGAMIRELGMLGDIAEMTGGHVIGDANFRVASIGAIDDADAATLTYATDAHYLQAALASRAGAILAAESVIDPEATYAKPIVAVESPRLALSSLLAAFESPRAKGPFIDPSATVDPSATIHADVFIGRDASVGAGSTIGARTVLAPGAIVGADVTIGEDGLIDTRAYVGDRSILGDRVILKPNAVIGSDGFGWAFLDGALRKIPQIGIVQLGDDVVIGANSCVDRAQTGITSVGIGTKIDNLVQIGHNCRIGKHCAIAAQCGLAGSTVVGDYVQIGGQVGIAGHLTIGSRARIAARSEIWGNIPEAVTVSGQPARLHREHLKVQALVRRLPKLFDRVDALEKATDTAQNR